MTLYGIDVSQWQGDIDWQAVKTQKQFAIIKMSGGDDGLYYDSKANQNYYAAKNAGIAVGLYHFAGGNDPIVEADYFVQACTPLEQDDVLVLDYEITSSGQVDWCWKFVNRVHDKTGVWPMLYISGSRVPAFIGSPVLANCGLWVAWWGADPESTLPVHVPYVMHQYSSDGTVPGISGRVDLDAWFGTVDQFKKYGWHAPVQEKPSEPTQPPTQPNPPVTVPAGPTPPEPDKPASPPPPTNEDNPLPAPAEDTPAPTEPAPTQATPAPSNKDNPQKPVETPPHTTPAQESPKVVVPEPHIYFTLWQLFVAFIKRLLGVDKKG